MKFKSFIISLLFACGLIAFTPSQAQKHRSSRAKTVHVKSYTKKNGTHVTSYRRASPHRK